MDADAAKRRFVQDTEPLFAFPQRLFGYLAFGDAAHANDETLLAADHGEPNADLDPEGLSRMLPGDPLEGLRAFRPNLAQPRHCILLGIGRRSHAKLASRELQDFRAGVAVHLARTAIHIEDLTCIGIVHEHGIVEGIQHGAGVFLTGAQFSRARHDQRFRPLALGYHGKQIQRRQHRQQPARNRNPLMGPLGMVGNERGVGLYLEPPQPVGERNILAVPQRHISNGFSRAQPRDPVIQHLLFAVRRQIAQAQYQPLRYGVL